MQNREYLYIDKTESLEEGIGRFPSIYIEGSAASGKTTAVNMLIERHSEKHSVIFDMKQELKDGEKFLEKLSLIKEQIKKENILVVFENLSENLESRIAEMIVEIVQNIFNDSGVIFVSRKKMQTEFLDLLWKQKLEVISMEQLLFSREEVSCLAKENDSVAIAEEVYQKTAGWSGCVSMVLRLAKKCGNKKSVEELLDSYEVKSYIQHEILSGLSSENMSLLSRIAACPWINENMAQEVWKIGQARERLEDFQRAGFLVYESEKKYWKLMPLFQRYIPVENSANADVINWYEKEGYITEALVCLKQSGKEEVYRKCMLRYYDRIYVLGLISEEVLKWTEKIPQLCYLRGAYDYHIQNFEGLQREIGILEKIKEKDHEIKEILLNLYYMDPNTSLAEWLELLETLCEQDEKFKLYHLLGNSTTYLCGIRDLSGMFACTKKEENQKARLWKRFLGETEWKCYQLARMDYYLETERKDSILEEDWNLLREKANLEEVWQIRMAKLYLLYKLQRIQPEESRGYRIYGMEASLKKEESSVCREISENISSLYAPWYGAKEKMSGWLRYSVMDNTMAITEENYLIFFCRAKGYLLLNQFDRAEKILKKLVPYLQSYRRSRLLAEAFFQYAIIHWEKDLKGQSVKNAIESFLISGNGRYVNFYISYGSRGRRVLEAYVDWQKMNAPEGWNRKKKYNYGNVLRMPVADYLEVIIRLAKKSTKSDRKVSEEYIEEHLTMMETIVLQDIGRGMSNAQICEKLEVKLPTVKGHIYSLYKKLGVNSRMQAVMRGKELGLLE